MPTHRGSLTEDDENSVYGEVYHGQKTDVPDDAIVVDFRKDEETLNWTKYGPEDSRERFSNWSDEKAQERRREIQEKLEDSGVSFDG